MLSRSSLMNGEPLVYIASSTRAFDGAPDVQRIDRFTHIVYAHDGRAPLHRDQRGGNAACDTLTDIAAGERADGRFARQSDHHRIAQRDQILEPAQQGEIMGYCLAEAKAWIDGDAVAGDTGALARRDALGEEALHFGDDIAVHDMLLHRRRLALHVHQTNSYRVPRSSQRFERTWLA